MSEMTLVEIKKLADAIEKHLKQENAGEYKFQKDQTQQYLDAASKIKGLEGKVPSTDEINKVLSFRDITVPALAVATERVGIQEMQNDKSINKVVSEMAYGGDELMVGIHRSRSVPQSNGEMLDIKGALTIRVRANVDRSTALQETRTFIREQVNQAFKDDSKI